MHVTVLFHSFGPYHRSRLDAAGRRMKVTGVEIAERTTDYEWEPVEATPSFDRVTLFSDTNTDNVSNETIKTKLQETLSTLSPDVVAVHGWSLPDALAATQWCLQTRTPSVLMSETNAHDYDRSWWRKVVKRRIVQAHSAGFVGGASHEVYLQKLGMNPERIFRGYDAVDNAHFSEGASDAQEDEENVRKKLDLPPHYFLASTRFLPRKNLDGLLDAYARYRRLSNAPWDLVILGDGPLWEDIVAKRSRLELDKHVHLPGFKQYNQLPLYYGLAGAFVHASTIEQWGLVVNEAMAAGLPVVVSDRCGCTPDLVEEGRNGFSFSPSDDGALTNALVRIAGPNCDRAAMGDASREIVADWTPETFARQLLRAARAAREHATLTSGKTSWFDTLLLEALMRR